MNEVINKEFTHLKIHTQYSICEGALRTSDLAKYCKTNQIKAVGLCDSNNLCGALEFSESIAKSKTQPIIGTQINVKHRDYIGKIPIFAKDLDGYKNLIKLSSKSFLEIKDDQEPHCLIEDIEKSLNFLKEIGAPTKKWIMSYPYGSFDNNTISIIKEKNCSYAFTSAQGIADLDKDRFKLPSKDTNDFPQ